MAQRRKKGSRGVPVYEPGIDYSEQGVKPTPETRRKHTVRGFAAMLDRNEIGPDMHRAALEIERVYCVRTAPLRVKSPSFELVSPGVAGDAELKMIDARRRYDQWANLLSARKKRGGPKALEIVIDMVVDERTLEEAAKNCGHRRSFTKYLLMHSLLEYAVISRWVHQAELQRFEAMHSRFSRRLLKAA